jgi:hypothetical protein
MLNAIKTLMQYVHVENTPLPIKVTKGSWLLLLAEGNATPDFPNTLTVFESADGVVYEEVASFAWKFLDILEPASLCVPVPKDYYVTWITPYGFLKSAILF